MIKLHVSVKIIKALFDKLSCFFYNHTERSRFWQFFLALLFGVHGSDGDRLQTFIFCIKCALQSVKLQSIFYIAWAKFTRSTFWKQKIHKNEIGHRCSYRCR